MNSDFEFGNFRKEMIPHLSEILHEPLPKALRTVATDINLLQVITHRRSIAEPSGCFHRRLFVSLSAVSLSVCQHDNCRTIKLRMMKLGV